MNVGGIGKIVGETETVKGRRVFWGQLYECWLAQKVRMIASDESHILAKQYELLPSGKCYRSVKINVTPFEQNSVLKTFIPKSVEL